jgi:hypothetical protein
MEKIVGIIKKTLGKEADRQKDRRAGAAVKEALQRIHKALAINPDLSPFGPITYGDEAKAGTGGSAALDGKDKKEDIKDKEIGPEEEKAAGEKKAKKKRRRNPLVKKMTPNAIVRRMRMGTESVSVCMDFFGESGPECFSEGNVVYINRDHPLFKRESRRNATFTMYIARLITQEISMYKETKSPRVAFSRQSKLLKDAFSEE